MNIGAQNKKSYAISSKETYNNEINQKQPSINIKIIHQKKYLLI